MKLLFSLGLLALMSLTLADQVKYNNYKVFRLIPKNEEERKVLLELEENNPGVIFWKHVRNVGLPIDILVPPHLLPMFQEGVLSRASSAQEMIDDVQSLIDAEAQGVRLNQEISPFLTWTQYHSTADIYAWVNEIAANHSNVARVASYGTSFEGRDLRYITINRGNTSKPIIFLDANIHAREWITNTIATWTIRELLEGGAQNWTNVFNFVIVPVMNPDGYEYTRTTDRMWRKTRSTYGSATCRGADPNRNWGFGWNTGGSSSFPCSDTYMGVSAFSEPETLAASRLLDSIANQTISYLSLHSYSQLLLIPYGTNLGRVPDHAEHMRIGALTATAIRRRYGVNFTPGNIVDLLYVASGASVDYMKGEFNTTLTYTFEMRDTGRYGFLLPADQIVPSCLEFMDGLNVILEQLQAKLPIKK